MAESSRIGGVVTGAEDAVGSLIEFDLDATGGTLAVVDPVERQRDVFGVDPPGALATPDRVSPEAVPAPVDAAVRFAPAAIDCHRIATIHVRDEDWTSLGTFAEAADVEFGDGTYLLEVSGPIKLYLRVAGAFALRADETSSRLRFGDGTAVTFAARSRHSRPSATITVPDDPTALMRAVSTFGGALKTTSPERSWPTLRGHPPAVRRGETLSIPPGVSAPDTGIRVVVPPSYEFVYPVAPLAYYLGADVVPGSPPRVEATTADGLVTRRLWATRGTDGGSSDLPDRSASPESVDWSEPPVAARRAVETAVERTLRRAHFVEVLVRDEGLYDVPLHERRAVRGALEEALPFDAAALYDLDPADRFPHYFALDYGWVAEYAPSWELASYLPPDPTGAELLPYVVDDLGFVRTLRAEEAMPTGGPDVSDEYGTEAREQLAALDDVLGASPTGDPPDTNTDAETDPNPDPDPTTVSIPASERGRNGDVLRVGWSGPGYPHGGTKHSRQAFERRVDREPTDPPIEVLVVCNAPEMTDELTAVDGIYGDDTPLPFEVGVHTECRVDEVADHLEAGADLLHYIGHADEDGLECTDGHLDVAELDASDVDVDTFLLNACRSYAQGTALLETGAIAGIVTSEEVSNASATRAGRAIARLLNAGYPLRVAAETVSGLTVGWQDYVIVGAGGHAITQRDTGNAPRYHVERGGGDDEDPVYRISGEAWTLPSDGPGMITKLYVEGSDHFLVGGSIPPVETDRAGIERFLSRGTYPLRIGSDSTLFWNTDLTLEDVDDLL